MENKVPFTMRLYLSGVSLGVGDVPAKLTETFEMQTDYPFRELGDEPFKTAPIRTVTVTGHDSDRYAEVILPDGQRTTIKWGYLFREIGPKIAPPNAEQ